MHIMPFFDRVTYGCNIHIMSMHVNAMRALHLHMCLLRLLTS